LGEPRSVVSDRLVVRGHDLNHSAMNTLGQWCVIDLWPEVMTLITQP